MKHRPPAAQQGFSLVELTVVLVIVALLSGGLMFGLSAQREAAALQDARRQLDAVKEALLGFAMANGRLPCPANPSLATSIANAGEEDKDKTNPNAPCNREYGVLPWVDLGVSETDPWGQRLTYFASSTFTAPTAGAQASFTMTTSTSGLANIQNIPGKTVAIELATVVVSHGPNGSGAYRPDGSKIADGVGGELENSNATQIFVADTPTPAFDDQLAWISPHLLKSRLVAVGKLP
jgi:prepilin-type N-terminal cleavage/methylation domain-containing protein